MACCNDCAEADARKRKMLGLLLLAVGVIGLFYTLHKGGR